MYGFIWRHLPGPTPVKILISVVLLAAVFMLLMEVIFPIISQYMPYNDVSVSGSSLVIALARRSLPWPQVQL